MTDTVIIALVAFTIIFGIVVAGVAIVAVKTMQHRSVVTPTLTTTPEPTVTPEPPRSNLTVTFLNVGQGDSALVVSPGGNTMLIDAGEYTSPRAGGSLDWVVATHPHEDHIGGMKGILDTYAIGTFVDSGYPHTTSVYRTMLETIDKKDIRYITVKSGDTLDYDANLTVDVLNPQTWFFSNINDNSVVMLMKYRNVSFLFAGDTERESELLYVKKLDGVTILKVGHHGSDTSTSAYLLSHTRPKVAVISVGENPYGHPSQDTIARLEKIGTRVYRTDLCGNVMVDTDGENYTVMSKC